MYSKQLNQGVDELISLINANIDNETAIRGISTGFDTLDTLTEGLHANTLTLIGSYEDIIRRDFALSVVKSVLTQQKRVVYFSHQTTSAELTARLMSSLSNIAVDKLVSGNFTDSYSAMFTVHAHEMKDLALDIVHEHILHLSDAEQVLSSISNQLFGNIDLIVIESLSSLWIDEYAGQRDDELKQVCHGLKAISENYHCPVVVLTELGKQNEKDQHRRPYFRDVIGSQLETVADNVYLLHQENNLEQTIELIIEKQTDGKAGSIYLQHEPDHSRFFEVT